jgi:hypothetical protein
MRVHGQIISHSALPKLQTPAITQRGLIHFPDLSTIEAVAMIAMKINTPITESFQLKTPHEL